MKMFSLIAIIFFSCSSPDCGFGIDELDKDSTLEIESYIHDEGDCGEWGGHRERMSFSKVGERYKLIFTRDSSDCIRPGLKDRPETDSATRKELIVDVDKFRLTMDYISKLNKHTPTSKLSSNAPDYYKVKFENNHKKIEITIDDSDNSWSLYEGFKKELLRQ